MTEYFSGHMTWKTRYTESHSFKNINISNLNSLLSLVVEQGRRSTTNSPSNGSKIWWHNSKKNRWTDSLRVTTLRLILHSDELNLSACHASPHSVPPCCPPLLAHSPPGSWCQSAGPWTPDGLVGLIPLVHVVCHWVNHSVLPGHPDKSWSDPAWSWWLHTLWIWGKGIILLSDE